MIVVDTNVIQYCWVHGQNTALAQAVRRHDPDWHAPALWRSELRNVLLEYRKRNLLSTMQCQGVMRSARHALADRVHELDDETVMEVAIAHGLTAYDAEFVALARALHVPLVTADKAILKACPETALSMADLVRLPPALN